MKDGQVALVGLGQLGEQLTDHVFLGVQVFDPFVVAETQGGLAQRKQEKGG